MAMDVVALAQRFVRIPSTTGNEAELAAVVKETVEPFFDTVCIDGIGNVIAQRIFDEKAPTVLFNGHMDTVDPGDMPDPFSGRIEDGAKFGAAGDVLYGRGSVDMKGALAAYIAAFSRLDELAQPPNVLFHAVVEEEPANGTGTTYAMQHLDVQPQVAVIGEASNLDICLGFRGYVQFCLETFGKTSHGSNPHGGINAVLTMRDFLNALDGYIQSLESKSHPFLGRATCAVTNIECSPGRLSVVPDRCRLTFDSRYFPGESPSDRKDELLAILEGLGEKNPDFKYELKVVSDRMRPTFIDPNTPYVQMMKQAVEQKTAQSPKLRSWQFTLDSSYIVNDFHIPTIGIGPGDEFIVHTAKESMPIKQLRMAEEIYLNFMRMFGCSRVAETQG